MAPCSHVAFGVDPVDCLRKVAKRSHPDYTGQETEVEREKKATPLRFFVATQVYVLWVIACQIRFFFNL